MHRLGQITGKTVPLAMLLCGIALLAVTLVVLRRPSRRDVPAR